MTFTNILGFLLNISTSWKICVKEQWLKKSLFWSFWLNVMICDLRQKKEGGISFGPSNHDRWLIQQRMHKFEYVLCCCWTNYSLSSKQSKLNFWNQLHPKIAFLCCFWTQTATWRPSHTILTSSVKAVLKAMRLTGWSLSLLKFTGKIWPAPFRGAK